MLTIRRNTNGWEWVVVDENNRHRFMCRKFYSIPGFMDEEGIEELRVEVEPGEFLWMEREMMEEMTEQGARGIIIA